MALKHRLLRPENLAPMAGSAAILAFVGVCFGRYLTDIATTLVVLPFRLLGIL